MSSLGPVRNPILEALDGLEHGLLNALRSSENWRDSPSRRQDGLAKGINPKGRASKKKAGERLPSPTRQGLSVCAAL